MAEILAGKRLEGRYEIQSLTGEGGMANVYKGFDLLEKRPVAIKILKEELSGNEELVRRFKNESRAISVLNHPNIVKVFDISVSGNLQYIIMEYIDGITLKEYIEQRGDPLTYKETLHFTSQILLALQHAHDKGIVHRDIKPQNIMLTEDGKIKVMDFGIARLARSESHTVTDQAIGSVHYISPEQAKGELTDSRSDLYSLGITMYEMLTGSLPFESDDVMSVAMQQISDEAVPVQQRNPSVPDGLAEIVTRAMSKSLRKRYQSALDMLRDIEEFKKNPSIKFEYEYLCNTAPARQKNTMMKQPPVHSRSQTKKHPEQNNGRPSERRRLPLLVPIVGGITLVVVLISAIMVLNIFQNSGNPLFGSVENIELQNFVGMQEAQVREILKQEPYTLLRTEFIYESNPDKPAGEILLQNPTPKRVKATQKVTFTVCEGTKLVTIPSEIIGMTRGEATKLVLSLGIRPYVVVQERDDVPLGRVFDTFPAPGSQVETTADAQITIYLAGAVHVTNVQVPNLLRIPSMQEAQALLQQVDLELSSAYKEEYSDAPAGTIIGQTPEPGALTYKYRTIRVTISKGPEPPPPPPIQNYIVPNMVGGSAEAAFAAASANHITLSWSQTYDASPAGTVLSQSVGAGTEVPEGTVVAILVSIGADPGTPPA